jgi:hypothetical protein
MTITRNVDRIIEEARRSEEKLGIVDPKLSVKHVLEKNVEDEFRSAPPPTVHDVEDYNAKLEVITTKPPEKKPEPPPEKKAELASAAAEAARARAYAYHNPSEENAVKAHQAQANAAEKYIELYEEKILKGEDVREELQREISAIASAVGEAGAKVVDAAKQAADAVAAFGRGVWYGIVGPPEDEDLRDEIAAVKAVGSALMAAGTTGAAIAAATGVGLPVAAALGSLSLPGWALIDNFAGRLEFIQSQREKEKKDAEKAREWEERQRRMQEEEIERMKEYTNWKIQRTAEAEAERAKMYEEASKKLEEKREEINRFWQKIEEERRKAEEEKRKKEEEERRFYAAQTEIKAILDEMKGLQQAAGNAWYAKNPQTALTLLQEAKDRVPVLKSKIEQYRDIFQKYNVYVAFMEQARAIENVLTANEKAWRGQNPNRNLVNAVTNYVNSTKHFNDKVTSYVSQKTVLSVHDPDDVKFVKQASRIERKNYATGYVLSNTAQTWLKTVPVVAYQPSKLDAKTITKFRLWLKKYYKTPLAAIPGYRWNKDSGYNYDKNKLTLMDKALKQAKVSWSDVRMLTLKELEAILRARQYIYQAAKRGYFDPYEYELYNRLKELLHLTDAQIAKLFRLEIPVTK